MERAPFGALFICSISRGSYVAFQSAYCPAFLIIGPHFAISDWRNLCRASGLARSALTGSAPSLARLALKSRSLIASCSAAFRRSTTGFGVPLGTYSPCHTTTSKPFSPCSSRVGMLGKEGTRFLLVTPYAFTLPPWIWPVVLVVWSHMKSTCPPRRSFIAGPVPL